MQGMWKNKKKYPVVAEHDNISYTGEIYQVSGNRCTYMCEVDWMILTTLGTLVRTHASENTPAKDLRPFSKPSPTTCTWKRQFMFVSPREAMSLTSETRFVDYHANGDPIVIGDDIVCPNLSAADVFRSIPTIGEFEGESPQVRVLLSNL